jgi:hypothetical protein
MIVLSMFLVIETFIMRSTSSWAGMRSVYQTRTIRQRLTSRVGPILPENRRLHGFYADR